MKFFADNDVAESACEYLEDRGHTVVRLRDVLPTDSPDPLVAKVAEESEAILMCHDGDYKRVAPRVPFGKRQQFRNLSRLHLKCPQPQACQRLEQAIDLIEFEWEAAQLRSDKRIHIVLGKDTIRTHR